MEMVLIKYKLLWLALRKQEDTFREVVKAFRKTASLSQAVFLENQGVRGIPAVLDRSKLRPHVRYCSWNIEWMDYFYADDNTFHITNPKNSIKDVHKICSNIASAVLEMDPDVLTILEGPGSLVRMELFNTKYLNGSFDCFG